MGYSSNEPESPPAPKTLKGVGILVVKELEDGSQTTLGIMFAPTPAKLKELIEQVHGKPMVVNMNQLHGGTLLFNQPSKQG